MNKDELKGKAENLKGRAKEAAGALTGNKKTQVEGTAERIKGAAQEKLGELQRKADEKLDKGKKVDRDLSNSDDDDEDI